MSPSEQRTLCVLTTGDWAWLVRISKNHCFKRRSETVGMLQQLNHSNRLLLVLGSELGANNIYSNFIHSCWRFLHWLVLIERDLFPSRRLQVHLHILMRTL